MRTDPTAELERAQIAGLPGYSAFAFLLASQVTVAAALQLASIPVGLMVSEVFLFAAPAFLVLRAANWRAVPLLKLRRPAHGLVALGFFTGAANFLVAGTMQALARSAAPQEFAHHFDATHLFEDSTGFELALMMLALGVVAPICEEIAFRGYLMTVLRSRYRKATAVAICSLLFALLHLDPVGMGARVELGALFALLVLWSGSLWPAIAAHAANNLIAGLVLVMSVLEPGKHSGPTSLLEELDLGFFGLIAVVVLLVAFRRVALRSGSRDPALEEIDPGAGHSLRLAPLGLAHLLRRIAWFGLLVLLVVGATLGANWRTLRVRVVDAQLSLQELERRLPDDASRRRFSQRLAAVRRRAREGKLGVDAYGELRKKLATLVPKADGPAPSLPELERVIAEADPAAP